MIKFIKCSNKSTKATAVIVFGFNLSSGAAAPYFNRKTVMKRILIIEFLLLALAGCSSPEYYRPNVDADSILVVGGSCAGKIAYFQKELSPGVLLLISPPIYQLRNSPNVAFSVGLTRGKSFQLLKKSMVIASESTGEIALDIVGSRSNGEGGLPVLTFGPLDRLEGSSPISDRVQEWGVWRPQGDLFHFDVKPAKGFLGESFYLTPPLFSVNGKPVAQLPTIHFKRVKRGLDFCFQ